MSRNAYAFFRFGGCRHCTTKLGGGIEAGPLNWGGVVPRTQKWGGDPLAAEGCANLGTPPLSVFLAPSLKKN